MTFQEQQKQLLDEIITRLTDISEFPEGLLPHLVYIEEEGDDYPVYKRYKLEAINPDGTCTLYNPRAGGSQTDRYLTEINIDWLHTIWMYYCDLTHTVEKTKELSAFLYPVDNFERNATDDEIIAAWEGNNDYDFPVLKLTPDELAASLNDDDSGYSDYYIRFINY